MTELVITPSEIKIIEVDCSTCNQTSVVEVEQSVIEVVTEGRQGPVGDAQSTYTHQQQVPSVTWVINHNLGAKPTVELLNSGSQEIEGDVVHTSNNQVIVSFTSPVSGLARLV